MKKNILNSLIFGIPLMVMVSTAPFFTYQIDRQSQLLNDLAIVAETHKPVVNNKSELLDAFAKYINAAGLKPESQKQSNVGYRTGNKPDTAYAPSTDNERIYGNPDAQFYIIEYSDFECQYCKQHFPIVMDLVDSSQGNIAMVFKHVPVHGQASRTEALAAECAVEQGGNPSFFQLSKALFRYSQSDGHGLSAPLDQIARETGLDPNRLLECINAARPSSKIADDVREAGQLGIQKTPTNIVVYGDKSAIVQGAVDGAGLMQMMAQLAGSGQK